MGKKFPTRNPTADDLDITGAQFKDVVFSWSATPKDVGTYTLTAVIPATDNTNEATAKLENIRISTRTVRASVNVEAASYTYTGGAITPKVEVKDGEKVIPDTEYTVEYKDNIAAGTATVTVVDREGGNYVVSGSTTFIIDKAPLSAAIVTLNPKEYTYDGTEKKPAVTVKMGGIIVAADEYTVGYSNNGIGGDHTNAGTVIVTVTAKEDGNYTGSNSDSFTIEPADLKDADVAFTSDTEKFYYTAYAWEPGITVTLGGKILTEDTDYTVSYTNNIEVGENTGKVIITGQGNYTGTAGRTFTVRYYDGEIPVTFNGKEETAWFLPGDVTVAAEGFAVAVTDGVRPSASDFKDSVSVPAKDVGNQVFYYKKTKTGTGYMTDGIRYKLKVDGDLPTGCIRLKYKFWDEFLSVVSFERYHAENKTVTITAEDTGSGIQTIEYAIVEGDRQYTTVDEVKDAENNAGLTWTVYDSGNRPVVKKDSPSVVYAKIMDNVGNITYISSDGILLDETAPTVSGLTIIEGSVTDGRAQAGLTVDEAAAVYLAAVPKAEADVTNVQAADVVATCGTDAIGAAGGTAIHNAAWHGTLAATETSLKGTIDLTGLAPYTEYTVYAVAVDKVIDMDNTTDEKNPVYTGNVSAVSSITFRTEKALPVIAQNPALSGTYGQSIGEMALTPGTAQDRDGAALAGTWAVGVAGQDEKPSVGTKKEVAVVFTPDSDGYESISVTVIPAVSERSLTAEGVSVSGVAGTYTYTGSEIKPPVVVDTGIPTEGIYISDSRAVLAEDDFTVSYSNNINAGTAFVILTGQRNYTGSVTRNFTIKKAPGRTVPDLTGSIVNNGETYTYTVTPIEGAVYRMGDDGAWTEAGQEGGNVFTGIMPGTTVTFYAKIPESPNYEEGDEKGIIVKFDKLTPAAPVLSYKIDRTDVNNVKATITPVDGAEYSFDGGTTWVNGNEKDGFHTSEQVTLAIRLKETATHNPSPAQILTVNLAKKDRKAPATFKLKYKANGETDYTVTIPPTEGCEYSFDGVTWSDGNVKTGVKAGETVTGYKRYKENNDYNASSAVSASETLKKFTVKAPVISPAGGGFTGSVNVTITCASPGAEIYYTTDGSIPTGSSMRYTGAFTVTPKVTVKAIALKDGFTDSVISTVQYTKKSSGTGGSSGSGGGSDSGGSSGSGGGSGTGGSSGSGGSDNGGSSDSGSSSGVGGGFGVGGSSSNESSLGSGSNSGSRGGNTAPGGFTNSLKADKNVKPGAGTVPVKPGTGKTAKPGSERKPENSTAQQAGPDIEKPFIKGENSKIGWDVIRAEEEKTAEGSTINVDMNGSTVVPGEIFDSIKGRDITITFDMGGGILWGVDGKKITTGQADSIDFSVKTGVSVIPVDIINNVTGENYSIQISLAHEGEFGLTAVLSVNLGEENAGLTAKLYYYRENTGELEFICEDEVAEDGTALFAFTHASDYLITVDGKESGNVTESAQPEGADKAAGDGAMAGKTPEAGQEKKTVWPIVAGIIALAAAAFAGVFVWRKKEEKKGDQ